MGADKGERVELAGAVIDGKDATRLAESFDRVADTMPLFSAAATALQLELVEVRKALDRNSDKLHKNSDNADEVKDGIAHVLSLIHI